MDSEGIGFGFADRKPARTNIFGSLEDFLNPEKHQHFPTVRLPKFFYEDLAEVGVEVWVKLLWYNPLLQGKWVAAWGLANAARKRGRLKGVNTWAENSSGNTLAALRAIAWTFGVKNVVGTVAVDTPPSKLHWLELLDCKAERTIGGIKKSHEMGEQPGFWCSRQYHSTDNPDFFDQVVGTQLWEEFGDRLTSAAAALGTSGTLEGSTRKHRERVPNFWAIGVAPDPDQMPGARSPSRLAEIGLNWRLALNGREPVIVTPKEAYFHSLWLSRYGLLVGPSGGGAFAGLLKDLRQCRADGSLELLRNRDGEIVSLFLCQDTPFQYLDKYTTHLEEPEFDELVAMPSPFA